ncbi:MAG: hypothetical protein C0616_02395 [Desulfuromonas sp.]|nr:MAG: hypothetical protein C0616_02395 [Desulfuromonas sp.]
MNLSSQRVSHLCHLILDSLCREGMIDCPDRAQAISALKASLADFVEQDQLIDQIVRRKLQKQNISPGSPEWHKLFERYANEERSRQA